MVFIEDKIKFTLLAATLFICMGRAHNNVLMYSDTMHSPWFVRLIKIETHYCPASTNTYQHPSSTLSFSLTHINIYESTCVHVWIQALSFIHSFIHGPLGFVTQRAWPNGEVIGSEGCVMVLCLLNTGIWSRSGDPSRVASLAMTWKT